MAILRTDGRGIWSDAQRRVKVTKITMDYLSEDHKYASFRVYFTGKTWSVAKDGLIYTDRQFERELRALLKKKGLEGARAVDYTEQGMQGDRYVSVCATGLFVKSWLKKGRTEIKL